MVFPTKMKRSFPAFLVFLFCLGCSAKQTVDFSDRKNFIVWAFSDIQPRNRKDRLAFEAAVNDVKDNFLRFDCSIAGGDIVQNPGGGQSFDAWKWFYSEMGKLPSRPIYEIAGNHDARKIETYLQNTKKPLHYAVKYGNLLMIFLSDETADSATTVPDGVFLWWKNLVEKNQDKIILTVSHSQLGGSGFFYNIISYRNVSGSERFISVLKKNRVDFWLFGHTHVPTILGGKNKKVSSLNGTAFINISAIREDYAVSYSESRFICLVPGSRDVLIRTRNHRKKVFVDAADFSLRLPFAFQYSGEPAEVITYSR